jgi:hypothetical protein
MCGTSPRKRLVKRRTKRFRGDARGRLPFQCPESSALLRPASFRDRSWRKMFGPNSPPDRFGIRCLLSTGALRLISVDFHEHVADAQGRALVVGDDDLDLLHTGHCRGMTTDVATG